MLKERQLCYGQLVEKMQVEINGEIRILRANMICIYLVYYSICMVIV